MVQVIETMEEAGGAEYIHFRVYRSKHDCILDRWQHGVSEQGKASIGTSVLRTPVDIEYKRAFNEAVQYGVRFLWVDDPEGLFPPAKRPNPP
jgi:hypothetical protein